MTDEEIEAALENHKDIIHRDCSACAYRNGHRLGTYSCNSTQLAKDTLDYINRLKAEKEQFEKRLQISPFGDDKIDELEEALKFIRISKEQIRKDTAREIFDYILHLSAPFTADIKALAEKYEVEIVEENKE